VFEPDLLRACASTAWEAFSTTGIFRMLQAASNRRPRSANLPQSSRQTVSTRSLWRKTSEAEVGRSFARRHVDLAYIAVRSTWPLTCYRSLRGFYNELSKAPPRLSR